MTNAVDHHRRLSADIDAVSVDQLKCLCLKMESAIFVFSLLVLVDKCQWWPTDVGVADTVDVGRLTPRKKLENFNILIL
jgi:hypothetical protein